MAAQDNLEAQWNQLIIKFNEDQESFQWAMWPKIVQVNKFHVYIIGGNNTTPKTQDSTFQRTRNLTY